MHLPFTTLDVFTSTPYKGNPLAIVHIPPGTEVSEEQKQKIAREFNLSETVFLHLPAEPSKDSSITPSNDLSRESAVTSSKDSSGQTLDFDIFTPLAHISFAGHPTIGTAIHISRHLYPSGQQFSQLRTIAGTIPFTYDAALGTATVQIPHAVRIHAARLVNPWVPAASRANNEGGSGEMQTRMGMQSDSQSQLQSQSQATTSAPRSNDDSDSNHQQQQQLQQHQQEAQSTPTLLSPNGSKASDTQTTSTTNNNTNSSTLASPPNLPSNHNEESGTVPIVSIVRGMAFGLARLPDLASLAAVSGPLVPPNERYGSRLLDQGSGWENGLLGSFYYVDLGYADAEGGATEARTEAAAEGADGSMAEGAATERYATDDQGRQSNHPKTHERPGNQNVNQITGTGTAPDRGTGTVTAPGTSTGPRLSDPPPVRTRRLRTRCIPSHEDPGTGSASAALCCYLCLTEQQRGNEQSRGDSEPATSGLARERHFHLTQGVEMGRQCDIFITVSMQPDGSAVEKVQLSGGGVRVMEGKLSID